MPGYKSRFVQPLLKRHECPICHHAMRNAMQTECGHLFCKDCLEPILNERRPICPLDQKEIKTEEIFPDKARRREILHLDVYCTYAARGCDWRGKLKELDDHVETCEHDSPVQCASHEQHIHPEIEHPMSSQQDVHYGENIPAQQMQVTAIGDQPFGNSTQQTFLPNSSSPRDLVEPYSADYPTHIDEGEERRQQLRTSLEDMLIRQSQRIDAQGEEISRLKCDLERVKKIFCSNIQHNVHVPQQLESLSSDYGSDVHTGVLGASTKYSEATPQQFKTLSAKVAKIDHSPDRCLSSSLDQELRLQLLQRANYNGILLWNIDDFNRRRQEEVDGVTLPLYSTPFYTSRHGYKMCARVYLNGDGLGKETHLSFFFVIMRGPSDALLVWPFKQKVTLTLINQAGKKHITNSFRPDPHSSSFQRPGRKEMNIASGCPMFIRVEHLLNEGFIKEDCIFLRIVVDTSDLPKVVP